MSIDEDGDNIHSLNDSKIKSYTDDMYFRTNTDTGGHSNQEAK